MLLNIEKLVYGGDGLARLAAETADGAPGKTVFVPFVLAGEQVEAEPVEQRQGFVRASLQRVVVASPQRVEPRCPYYGRCGGCHYQHANYEHQLAIKREILLENLRRIGKLEWTGEVQVHSGETWQYRNRTRLQVVHGPPFGLAYFRQDSHELLAVDECPISSPLIHRAMSALVRAGNEGATPREVAEVELFANHNDSELHMELTLAGGARFRAPEFERWWQQVQALLPEAKGMAAFAPEPRSRAGHEVRPLGTLGAKQMTVRVAERDFGVSAGAFFQTNRYLNEELLQVVTAGRAGALALDLYAGVGLFGCVLARSFERVIAVEASTPSFRDLRRNAPENLQAIHETTERYLELAQLPNPPDLVVVDPPRAGLGAKVTRALVQLAPQQITYVSCDPATLARDIWVLLESGFRIEQLHLVDLFPQTFHIESVVHLARGA